MTGDTRGKVIERSLEQASRQLHGERWHLVCKLSGMDAAIDALDRAGFAVYCPHVTLLKPPPQRKLAPSQRKFAYMLAKPTVCPLFPGYFLVGLGDRDWHDIFGVCRIDGLAIDDNRPVAIDSRFLDRMRAAEVRGSIPGETPLKLLLEEGDLVRVLDGPFAGQGATVESLGEVEVGKLDDRTRIWIALQLFGRLSRVETTLGNVVKL